MDRAEMIERLQRALSIRHIDRTVPMTWCDADPVIEILEALKAEEHDPMNGEPVPFCIV
jgi:hypothetical protein